MKTLNLEAVKAAIKAQKWDKYSFVYAMDNMFPYRYWDSYKKPELLQRFYEAIQDENNFRKISNYTTFRSVECYTITEDAKVEYSNLPQNENFVITKEYLSPGSEFVNATDEQKGQIKKDGFTVHFLIYDDDDILYYGGYLKTELEGSEDAFSPLDDYAGPNAGAVDIRYKEKDGQYHSL